MTALSNAVPPSGNDYGGDEISALVLDTGCSTTRAGFAGEDVPKSVVSTYYGRDDTSSSYIFGDNSIHMPRPGVEILNPLAKDGTVEDWEAATKLWEYSITSRLTNPKPRNPMNNGLNDTNGLSKDEIQAMELDGTEGQESFLEENPLLMTEAGLNPTKNREKTIELAMEDWGCPAFWLVRNGVSAAFAAGKPTALVVDIGAASTGVTAIVDGLVLRKSVQRTPLAGDFVSDQVRLLFSSSQPPIPLTPYYLVASKYPVDANQPPVATYRTFPPEMAPTRSYRALQESRLLTEFKESVVQVHPASALSRATTDLSSLPGRPFEFPDGYNQVFGIDRFRPAEPLFDPKSAIASADSPAPSPSQSIVAAVKASLEQVDVDIRAHMLQNVVVTGGTSLIQGLVDRLSTELGQLYPSARVRITASGNVYERRFASWIGGSILASLGTFHQMWISKKEYEEQGPGVVEKRCK